MYRAHALSIVMLLVPLAEAVAAQGATHPEAVTVARATEVPDCALHVDAAARKGGDGSTAKPFKSIAAAVEAADEGAVICVAEGTYAEEIKPGTKGFTLAGGFESGSEFKTRDSAEHVSLAKGNGKGSFLSISDPGPKGDQLTAIDGFEITGYARAIVRDHWEAQRFDLTNAFIHDNKCTDDTLWGAGFFLRNTSGAIRGNVIRNNACGRGGAGVLLDEVNTNTVLVESNRVEGNSGTEASSSHGGAFHFGVNKLTVTGNLFLENTVTQWGGGLYVGAYTQGNQHTTAKMSWNVYRDNRAGDSGGGFFCDDGANCSSEHEVLVGNCGGNVLVDGGAGGSGPTTAKFDHITSVGARSPDCKDAGPGLWVDTWDAQAPDSYTITNSLFWNNEPGKDLRATCGNRCGQIKVSVDHSMLDAKPGEGIKIKYGASITAPADPMFVDAKAGDFNLQPDSPARGKGKGAADLGAIGAGDAGGGGARTEAEETEPAPKAKPEKVARKASKADESEAESSEGDEVPAKVAAGGDAHEKEAFTEAKELGSAEAWEAFLKSYPEGFRADMARAYLKKLGAEADAPEPAAEKPAKSRADKAEEAESAEEGAAASKPDKPAKGASAAGAWDPAFGATSPGKPAVARGASYMGFEERFNRYYTDPDWKPSQTVFVSPEGGGDGESRGSPMAVADAISGAKPGTKIHFTRGAYEGCFELNKDTGGTYDQPVVLFGERKRDQTIGVTMSCCKSARKTCFNLEGADYVAVDGFEFEGGAYGVRAIGLGYAASEHARGIAVLNNKGHDQDKDPFFSGQVDWAVWEGNLGYGAKKGDGHGIYISNGSDWNIVRFNETYSNASSDFQINADPASTCRDEGIAFDDPACDAYAGEGEGGRGASDYFLVEGNYFHHSDVGPNFTSVRRSLVRNNVFGPQTRHNVSFWQETDNPKLGSSDNRILHNIFLTTARLSVQFINGSTRNEFANNLLIGVTTEGGEAKANPQAVLMEVDGSVGDNVYRGNMYLSGRLEGREASSDETAREDFSPGWFANFPVEMSHDAGDFTPTADAPFLDAGKRSADAPSDRTGQARGRKVDLGPIEIE